MSLDDLKVDLGSVDYDDRTLEFLRRDFSILTKGIEGKRLEDINLDAVMELLDMLKSEVQNVKDGIRARDNFISYTMKPEEMSSVFSKEPEASGNDERGIE